MVTAHTLLEPSDLYPAATVAELTGFSIWSIRRWGRLGYIRKFRVTTRTIRFSLEDVISFLTARLERNGN
jgi:predicted site-specific integrase-resolvase